MSAAPFSTVAGGVRIAVRATPRARRSAIEGVVLDGEGRAALKLRLAAPPVGGAANAALVAFLAEALAVPRRAVTVAFGATARHKQIEVAGDPTAIAARLEALIAAAEKVATPA